MTGTKRLSGKSLKRKGDAFEREVAHWFNEKLFNGVERVSRAPLSGGGNGIGGADLNGLPLVYPELKRTEKHNPRTALEQAERSKERKQCPDAVVVINRKSQEKLPDAVVSMRLHDFTDMLEIIYRFHGYIQTLELDQSPVDDDNQMSFLSDA